MLDNELHDVTTLVVIIRLVALFHDVWTFMIARAFDRSHDLTTRLQ